MSNIIVTRTIYLQSHRDEVMIDKPVSQLEERKNLSQAKPTTRAERICGVYGYNRVFAWCLEGLKKIMEK